MTESQLIKYNKTALVDMVLRLEHNKKEDDKKHQKAINEERNLSAKSIASFVNINTDLQETNLKLLEENHDLKITIRNVLSIKCDKVA